MKNYGYFAGGSWHDPATGEWLDATDPATGEVWARIPRCGAEDVARAVAAADDCFRSQEWQGLHPALRGRLLHRMADVLERHAKPLAELETRDNGKRYRDSLGALSGPLPATLRYYAGLAEGIEGRFIPVEASDMLNFTQQVPYGVAACITAWNSPLLIAVWKLAPAIAAGNTVVLKPSEHASVATLALAEVIQEADLPSGLLNVVTGLGDEAGRLLVEHPSVAIVSFTGGTAGGRAVAMAAARGPKPVILELDGKSPQIVLEDADLDLAAAGIVGGIFPPSGQSCIAGSRVIVQRAVHDDLVSRLVDIAQRAGWGPPAKPETQISTIANRPHMDRVTAAIESARQDGAQCVAGGRIGDGPALFVEPTIFTGVRPDMALAREEVFGPVLAVIAVKDEAEALAVANDSDYGLAAGIWTGDTARGLRLSGQIEAGTVYVNTYFHASPSSPVGGMKGSGYGRENGVEGLQAFLQTRSVWVATRPVAGDPFA